MRLVDPWEPLVGGFITGKFSPGKEPLISATGKMQARAFLHLYKDIITDTNRERLKAFAINHGHNISELAI